MATETTNHIDLLKLIESNRKEKALLDIRKIRNDFEDSLKKYDITIDFEKNVLNFNTVQFVPKTDLLREYIPAPEDLKKLTNMLSKSINDKLEEARQEQKKQKQTIPNKRWVGGVPSPGFREGLGPMATIMGKSLAYASDEDNNVFLRAVSGTAGGIIAGIFVVSFMSVVGWVIPLLDFSIGEILQKEGSINLYKDDEDNVYAQMNLGQEGGSRIQKLLKKYS